MPSIRRNITANFFGRIWVSVISIIFVPVYIHFIGIEAYGLLGIFTTIQTVLNLLDMGLSTTLNREIAKHTALNEDKQYINNLVFTMERIYHIIAILTGIGLILASWFFATHWVNTDKLDTRTVILAFMLIGVNFAALFPGSLYQGGLMGLQ
jgi:O-antigen/teichoic acid export membrane protein